MANYSTTEFKAGLKILLEGEPYSIIRNEFVKPGKGQAFNRVKLRNLMNSRVVEKTFKSNESVQSADVLSLQAKFLYREGGSYYFMDNSTFEQYIASEDTVGDNSRWLIEDVDYELILHNGVPIQVVPPKIMELTVTSSEPGVRGDTATAGTKGAVLQTDAVIRVPFFVSEGDLIKVDTRTGEYLGRQR